jgi:hypothetical protein
MPIIEPERLPPMPPDESIPRDLPLRDEKAPIIIADSIQPDSIDEHLEYESEETKLPDIEPTLGEMEIKLKPPELERPFPPQLQPARRPEMVSNDLFPF